MQFSPKVGAVQLIISGVNRSEKDATLKGNRQRVRHITGIQGYLPSLKHNICDPACVHYVFPSIGMSATCLGQVLPTYLNPINEGIIEN